MPDIGILLPIPRIGITPASGMKLFVYAPGGTTKRNTYNASDLASANANPVVADSAGLFGNIFIDPALGYKIVLAPSTDTDPPTSPILTVDNLWLPGAHIDALVCQGRLTLTSGTPVTTSDVSGAGTLYFTPYGGSSIALYNTTKSAWEVHTFTEVSLSLSGVVFEQCYDVFLYDNAGTKTLEIVAWTDVTTRATALAQQNGVYVKTGSANKRYLGTFVTVGSGQVSDTAQRRGLWNYYNRVARPLLRLEDTNTWTYTTATFRAANNVTGNSLDVVVGVAEDALDVQVRAHGSNDTGGMSLSVSIGADSTTTPSTSALTGRQGISTNMLNIIMQLAASLRITPAAGRHTYTWLEHSGATGTTTWYGDNGGTLVQSGISGLWRC